MDGTSQLLGVETMHFHIIRHDHDTRTNHPLDPVGLGVRPTYSDARAVAEQDEKQFRTPAAQRWITHRWETRSCLDDSHVAGPYG